MSKRQKQPEEPTTQPVPSGQEATPKAAASGRFEKGHPYLGNRNWDKVKVFDKPEYRTPYKFTMYMPGKKPKVSGVPELWLQVAIESGLVEMGSLEEGGRGAELLNPIDGAPEAYATHESLEALIAKGLADTLAEMEKTKK